jgi:hypothetical protein
MNAIVTMGGSNALTPTSMDSAMQLAEMMARGKLVPTHLQNSPGDCLMVIEAAMRWGMSPFAVAQCTSVIQGKLMFEGKLVAAALNASGIMAARLDYEFTGTNDNRVVTVRGKLVGETKAREITLSLEAAKTNNQMWTKQPDQQLVYAGTRVWARRHAPEVMLGVYAPEEFEQMREEQFNGTTIEAKAEAPPPPPSRRDAINKEIPLSPATPPSNGNGKTRHSIAPPAGAPDEAWRECLDKVAPALARLRTVALVEEMAAGPTCSDIVANGPEGARAELAQLLADNVARFRTAPDTPADELGEVAIAGEEKLAAG